MLQIFLSDFEGGMGIVELPMVYIRKFLNFVATVVYALFNNPLEKRQHSFIKRGGGGGSTAVYKLDKKNTFSYGMASLSGVCARAYTHFFCKEL